VLRADLGSVSAKDGQRGLVHTVTNAVEGGTAGGIAHVVQIRTCRIRRAIRLNPGVINSL
jgi:hypothetical protein